MRGVGVGVAIALALGMSVVGGVFYIVREYQQVVITEFGRPVGNPVTEAGDAVMETFVEIGDAIFGTPTKKKDD